jgi:tRNA pseudouridine38-40 synthase
MSQFFRYRMKLAYQGEEFGGWQIQPNAKSIQESLQKALGLIFQTHVAVIGAGRTDTGVHAESQIAHFDLRMPIENLKKVLYSLNGILPWQIRVLAIEACASDFHSRYNALRKVYHYFIHDDPVLNPFDRPYRWFVQQPLEGKLLQKACESFVGTHDFKAFANENHKGVAAHDSIRTLFRLDSKKITGGYRLEFEGDGFLYKMVRNCTGLIVEVAKGKKRCTDIHTLLNQTNRDKVGYCAPAHGLFMHDIIYPNRCGPTHFLSLEDE